MKELKKNSCIIWAFSMRFILDTHVLIERLLKPSRLSSKVRSIFLDEENDFLIPTVAFLEIQYLTEIGRIEMDIDQTLSTIQETERFQLIPYDEAAMFQSLHLNTTRDPFDRIILAQALARSHKILTKDRWMKRTAPHLVVY